MSVLKFIQAINSCFTMESFMWTFLVSHYNLCNLVLSFSWTFVSQLRIKFEEVFLISTQWMLSSLDNNHLIMKWWLSCKDIILSVLIKSFDIFFFDSLFTLYCAADHSYKIQERTEEFLYVHIWIHNTNCDSVKDCKHFLN